MDELTDKMLSKRGHTCPGRCGADGWSITGLTPGQGTYPGCGFHLWREHIWEVTDQCFSLSLTHSLSNQQQQQNILG